MEVSLTKYIVAADCGTTGSKAVVYDLTGKPIASGYQEYGLEFPNSGWVDQDPDLLFETCVKVIGEAVRNSKVTVSDIGALSMSTQRCTVIPVAKDGKALRKGISWQDNRTDKQCELIRQRIGAEQFYDNTGLPVANVWSLPKIMWIRENESDLFRKTDKFVNVQAYLNRLFGADGFYDDYSNVSLHGLMSVTKLEWIDDFLRETEVPRDKLPELVRSGRKVGTLNKSIASATGLLEGTPLISGGGDQQCAAVGANVIEEGDCEVTLGTAGVTICSLDQPRLDPERTIPCLVHAVDDKWTCEGLQNAAGAALKWLRDILQQGHQNTAVDYDYLTNLASESSAGANGLTFLPYFAGAGAPLWNGSARGVLFGMGLGSNLGDVTRAVMEGVSFETASILDNFKRRGISINEVRASGGGAQSKLWGQIQADIFGIPVRCLAVPDATILGAAVLAAYGVGVYETVAEGAKAMVHTTTDYQPDMKTHQIYQEKRDHFDRLYSSLEEGKLF
ncbi:MAG: xylulose kinase [Gammaproteobacteria bacterium]|nr:MAG: xylulose kinase [Gammaproteobacteria bacterium]